MMLLLYDDMLILHNMHQNNNHHHIIILILIKNVVVAGATTTTVDGMVMLRRECPSDLCGCRQQVQKTCTGLCLIGVLEASEKKSKGSRVGSYMTCIVLRELCKCPIGVI